MSFQGTQAVSFRVRVQGQDKRPLQCPNMFIGTVISTVLIGQ